MKKKSRLLKNIVLVLFITGLLGVIGTFLLGRTETARYLLRNINERSAWNIELAHFSWNLWTSKINARDVHIVNRDNKREVRVKNFELHYRPWDLFRGKFYVRSFKIGEVRLYLPPVVKKKRRLPRLLDVTKLLFLQNIIIRDGLVHDVGITFPKEVELNVDEVRLGLKPTMMRLTSLNVHVNGLSLYRREAPLASVAALTIKATTQLPRWKKEFPYLNALTGKLKIHDARLEEIPIDSLNAELRYFDDQLGLDPFEVVVGGKSLSGSLKADAAKKTWLASLTIPKPISLPYIGREMTTIDTAGELSGSVEAKGQGFIPSESSGQATASFAHRFSISPQDPVMASAKASWKDGVIKISNGRVMVQNDSVEAQGTIDIVKKRVSLQGQGRNFPAEALFDKFRNPLFHKLFGPSDVTGSFDGWGKKFKAKVTATTHNGGYQPMVAEKVETLLESTYDRMDISWQVFEQGKKTGEADLVVHFGKKVGDEPRPKRLDLKVGVNEHPLDKLFPEWGLAGLASGRASIVGPHTSFTGQAQASIKNGSWLKAAFNDAQADLDISRRRIIIKNIRFAPPKIEEVVFPEPVIIDLVPGSLRMHGTPSPKFSLDITYNYDRRLWQIRKITYIDSLEENRRLDVSGSLVMAGAVNLKMDGAVDLQALIPLGFLVREAEGPVDIDLRAGGTLKNPSFQGVMQLNKCLISPRFIRLPMEKVEGKLKFEGHTIKFENVTGNMEDGTFTLNGQVQHAGLSFAAADLKLSGKYMTFRTDDGSFRMEFDGNVSLDGKFPSPLLSGDISILDGKYSKDFNLLEAFTKGKKPLPRVKAEKMDFVPRLDLRVRNSGDLFIRNNVGDIGLRADLHIKGTRAKPVVGGAVEATEGKVHYLGLDFDITRGFIEFREAVENPHLEVVAQKEINIYNVTVEVHGPIDNLMMDLSASSPAGPLEKRDIISLLAFGMTESEREELAVQKGEQFGVAMAAQQLTHVIERPVKKFAHLDTFRLEAADPTSQSISRVAVGKQLSDRLNVHFTTDIKTTDAVQTVVAEYLFTDNLLLKGSRSTDGQYEMSGVLRFRLR